MSNRWSHVRLRYLVITPALLLAVVVVTFALLNAEPRAVAQDDTTKPLEQPPEDQTYMGTLQCGACHFTQYGAWQKTKHAKAFETLPAKYKTDAECLKCHSTGYGEPTGYKDNTTASLAGTSCEACHGPGSKHGEIAKTFAGKELTEQQEKYVRSTIHKILPVNACVKCHVSKAHKPHPPYDKPKGR